MTAYVVVQMTVHDRERYGRYAASVRPTLEPYGGRMLAADEAELVEGSAPHRRLVLIAFPDKPSARAWAEGPEYQAIVAERRASSEAAALLVEGF